MKTNIKKIGLLYVTRHIFLIHGGILCLRQCEDSNNN